MSNRRIPVRVCLEVVAVCGLVACASRAPSPPSPNTSPSGRRVGEFVWQDLMTDDAEKSRKFYEQLFGWTFERSDRLGRPYSALVGSFLWRDCFTKDVELAGTFYSNLAGLATTQQPRPDSLVQYILTRSGPGPVAGVLPIGDKPIKPNWLPYVRVNDPAAVAVRAEQLGGRIIVRASPEIRKGSVAVILDPSGAAIALQKWPF